MSPDPTPAPSVESSPRTSARHIRRNRLDRRKTDGFPPAGCPDRRVQAERRGIQVVEFDFDERISIGTPRP
ncbi:MAG: hypothetical protein KA182_01905 [Propionivibrio sp.]|jgi:hypothetical protein|nr:hypothetical protein [Propionivibrio sp.]